MNRQRPKRPHGQLRQSQVVTTFGPGAMIDLPSDAVMVAGLDHWRGVDRQVFEERLAAKVQNLLKLPAVKLFAPPPETDDPNAPPTGIGVWMFPLWFVAQYEERRERNILSRPLVHFQSLVKGRYPGPDRNKPYPVVPIRFVQACTRGHISDIDWHLYVHERGNPCRRQLWLDERGTSGDLADVTVRCECGLSKTMAAAAKFQAHPFGSCNGQRPWLGPRAAEHCGGADGKAEPSRLLVRSASNAYFAQKLSAISIPDASAELRKAVDTVWDDYLQYVDASAGVAHERRKAKVHAAIERFTDDEVWKEIQRRKASAAPPPKGIKQAEIETLLSSMVGTTEDVPDGDYYARAMPIAQPSPTLAAVERVVLVHRLREVIAQVGFTRFESSVPDVDGELSLDVTRADLAIDTTWVPAVENRGEGFFIAFMLIMSDDDSPAARVELVWSGPESASASTRDTGVIVPELFASARRSVLVAGYAVHQGMRVFARLAENMDGNAGLEVRIFTNIARPRGDARSESELVRVFADRFRGEQWPRGSRLPRVLYDPRALSQTRGPRACLHAKCLIVDDERRLVTSANFTAAAMDRNIEAGVIVHDPGFASRLRSQFDALEGARVVRSVPGLM